MNYTTGEWTKGDRGSIDDKEGYPIAIVFPDTRLASNDSIAKRVANANLIAAAPEMYKALKAIIAKRMECHETESASIPSEIETAYKALAKAEGRRA